MAVSQKEMTQHLSDEKNGKDKTKTRRKTRKATPESKLKQLTEKIAALEKENAELKDRFLRKVAEFDNYKKRTEAEIANLALTANADFIKELLPVFDDFERSLEAAKGSEDFKTFFQGVELIYKNLMKVLEKRGVKPMQSVGEPFDPEKHEALLQVENKDFPPGTVVEEHLKGYMLHDKVLRHSQVLVNKND